MVRALAVFVLSAMPAEVQPDRLELTPTVELATGEEVSLRVGAHYRPQGASADFQRQVAAQLSQGSAAQLLSIAAGKPTKVTLERDGSVRIQVELYRTSLASSESFLVDNAGLMAGSLLADETALSKSVEELAGPEAVLVMRAAFLLSGQPETEELASAAIVLARDPQVQAAASLLARSGREKSEALAVAIASGGEGSLEAIADAAQSIVRQALNAQRAAEFVNREWRRMRQSSEIQRFQAEGRTQIDSVEALVRERWHATTSDSRNAARQAAVQATDQARTRAKHLERQVHQLGTRVGQRAGDWAAHSRQRVNAFGHDAAVTAAAQAEAARRSAQHASQRARDDLGRSAETARQRAADEARVRSEQLRREAEAKAAQARQAGSRLLDRLKRRGG